jgi:hypothetical protein
MRKLHQILLPMLICFAPLIASAQGPGAQGGGSFRVQCPTATLLHPGGASSGNPTPDQSEARYSGPRYRTATTSPVDPFTQKSYTFSPALSFVDHGGAIKCQEISGGDGMMTEADGNQTYLFSFGPLSGLNAIQNGQPGTQFPSVFNTPYCDNAYAGNYINGQPNPNAPGGLCNANTDPNGAVGYVGPTAGADAGAIMNTGVLNGNIPAPLMAFDEDDEFLLTLSNVGMIMRPDLFEQHTVHFHGYPNASSFYDGVPDASLAINIGGSFTYYYLAPDAGTYFWHCHITPPEHLQMGMVGQLFVRPRQNRLTDSANLFDSLAGCAHVPGAPTSPACPARGVSTVVGQQSDLRTACNPVTDILCSTPIPATRTTAAQPTGGALYVYNDGDGSTAYDIDVPLQIHGFDPNFHFVGMTFNPEGFSDMKDKYFLLNGRSYPDTVGVAGGPADALGQLAGASNPDPASHAISTQDTDSISRFAQPLHSLITLSASGGHACAATVTICGQKAALRIADLDVQEYQTLSSIGIPMLLVGFNAKILRDQAGNNLYIKTNSITLGGGESLDVILDSTGIAPGTYFLYTPQLDHLSNDAENFGGLMTEVVVTP